MQFSTFNIAGPILVTPKRNGDARGFFSETFRHDLFHATVGDVGFLQDNHSVSASRGTIRGLHYQKPPRAQGKLVRVTRGAIIDVAVDIRRGSPTYGHHIAVELSTENWSQLWIPPGFLHGLCTLADNTEVLYKVTDYYSPQHDAAVRWNDPAIGIMWPVAEDEAVLSAKDMAAPLLSDIEPVFSFGH